MRAALSSKSIVHRAYGSSNHENRLGTEIVMVFVGGSTTPTPVHRELIAASSEFFAKALNGNFRERDGIVRLIDQSPTDFACYVQWLYYDRFDVDPARPWTQSLRLNVMGSFLQDRCFRNATIDTFIVNNQTKGGFPVTLAAPAFEQLPKSSPFRKLLIDFWIFGRSPDWFTFSERPEDDTKVAPAEFWVEVAKGFLLHPSPADKTPWKTDRCQYHEHLEGEGRCT